MSFASVSNHQFEKHVARRSRKKAWALAQQKFRTLPDAQRGQMIAAFKRERQSDPQLDWAEWLAANLR